MKKEHWIHSIVQKNYFITNSSDPENGDGFSLTRIILFYFGPLVQFSQINR